MTEADILRVTAIGGGHGLAGVAEAFGQVSDAFEQPVEITALSTIPDSGSATGEVRDLLHRLGVGAYGLGDLRNVLGRVSTNAGGGLFGHRLGPNDSMGTVGDLNERFRAAVGQSEASEELVDATLDGALDIADRLPHLKGHTYGNFVLASLCRNFGLVTGLNHANKMLETSAHVQTMTEDPHDLRMYDNRAFYETEAVIDDRRVEDPEHASVWLTPQAWITEEALVAIEEADILIIAPGSLWTSTLPALAVEGVSKAIQHQASRNNTSRLIVANLVQEYNAGDMTLEQYVRKIEAMAGSRFGVIYNISTDGMPDGYKALTDHERALGERGFGAQLVSPTLPDQDPNDPLAHRRTGVLHDPEALARAVSDVHRTITLNQLLSV